MKNDILSDPLHGVGEFVLHLSPNLLSFVLRLTLGLGLPALLCFVSFRQGSRSVFLQVTVDHGLFRRIEFIPRHEKQISCLTTLLPVVGPALPGFDTGCLCEWLSAQVQGGRFCTGIIDDCTISFMHVRLLPVRFGMKTIRSEIDRLLAMRRLYQMILFQAAGISPTSALQVPDALPLNSCSSLN
jgi:hypothetical protein